MIQKYESIIIEVVCKALVPLIQLFGLYVIVFGHYGPGGGFQGGVILATSVILLRLCLGRERSYQKFPPVLATVLGVSGLLIFVGAGLVPLLFGGSFLDYAYLPGPDLEAAELRSFGITVVEAGIGLTVMGACILIFDSLVDGGRNV